jgi:hypothetical protein
MHIGALLQELPQALRAALGQGMGDRDRAAKPRHVLHGIGAADAVEAAGGGGRDQVFERTRGRL